MAKPKALVIYYSKSGSNEKLALSLKIKLKADIQKLEPVGVDMIFFSVLRTLFRKPKKFKPIKYELSDYKEIYLVSPIWIGTLPAITRTFLQDSHKQIKSLIFMSVSGFGEKNTKIKPELKKILGNKFKKGFLFNEKKASKKFLDEQLTKILK